MTTVPLSTLEPIGHESHPWQPSLEHASRSQVRKHTGPYLAAAPAEIASLELRLTSALATELTEASQRIARFDEHVRTRLDGQPAGPLSAILLRTESASSSQIENLTVGARQIALAEIGARSSRNAQIVSGNVRAMEAAIGLSEDVTAENILAMHRALLSSTLPTEAGRWRTEQVWIGGSNVGPHRADFVAPHHGRVQHDVSDLILFANRDDVPVLAQAAIAHAQFETIHPFIDGNGRTGRALVHAMLTSKDVTRHSTAPVSAGLLRDTAGYFEALEAYRAGDVAPILTCFSEAAIYAAGRGTELVDELVEARDTFRERITARRTALAWALADSLVGQPVITSPYVATRFEVTLATAQSAIDHLVSHGILAQSGDARRDRIWQAPDVLGVLDDFAASIRRTRG